MKWWLKLALISLCFWVVPTVVLGRKNGIKKDFTRNTVRLLIHRVRHTSSNASLSSSKHKIQKSAKRLSARDLVPETITIVKKEEAIKASALPGAEGEEFEVSDEQENDRRKKLRAQKQEQSENAAMLGNNVPLMLGMNPSEASVVYGANLESFGETSSAQGDDKEEGGLKKQNSRTNKTGGSTEGDTLVKQIEDIAHQLDNGGKLENGSRVDAVKEYDSKPGNLSHTSVDTSNTTLPSAEYEEDETSSSGAEANGSPGHSISLAHPKQNDSLTWPVVDDDEESKSDGPKKEKAARNTSSKATGESSRNVLKNSTDVSRRGDAAGPEGFECPWVCFWTCHSYCPRECCYNPYHCDTVCRTFCAPTCQERCCAPGSARLPKLQLSFQTSAAAPVDAEGLSSVGRAQVANLQGDPPGLVPVPIYGESVSAAHDREMEVRRFEEIHKAREMVARMSGYPLNCPLFCSQICTPGLCDRHCCNKRLVIQHASPAQDAPSPARDLPSPSSSLPLQASFIAEVQRAWKMAHEAASLHSTSPLQDTSSASSNIPLQKVEPLAPPVMAPPAPASAGRPAAQKLDPDSLAAIVGIPSVAHDFAAPFTNSRSASTVQPAGPVNNTLTQIAPYQTYRWPDTQQPVLGGGQPSVAAIASESVGPVMNQAPIRSALTNPEHLKPITGVIRTIQDVCPPICRTSCIEECPNQCCHNSRVTPKVAV